MQLLDGKGLANTIKEELAQEVDALGTKRRKACLAAILVGNDPASRAYVDHKVKACEKVGLDSKLVEKEATITEDQLLQLIDSLNQDDSVDGFIVQLPLPDHINAQKVIEQIKPTKDVDGFHPVNVGKMALGLSAPISATPKGILTLLSRYNIETSGKHCVVIGRSNIVGRPMSILLSQSTEPGNCTVTVCHSRTRNLETISKQADIIIAAIGRPKFVTANMVKEGAVVIDVGINRIEDHSRKSGSRLVGDVDFDSVASKCSYITPVPGGVGPMTVVSLIENTLEAYKMGL